MKNLQGTYTSYTALVLCQYSSPSKEAARFISPEDGLNDKE